LYSPYPTLPGGSMRWELCYPGNTAVNSISAHVLIPLAVNSKSERKVNSLQPLEIKPANFGMLVHLSDNLANSHPIKLSYISTHQTIIFLKTKAYHCDRSGADSPVQGVFACSVGRHNLKVIGVIARSWVVALFRQAVIKLAVIVFCLQCLLSKKKKKE
jgi:hypothetical protein